MRDPKKFQALTQLLRLNLSNNAVIQSTKEVSFSNALIKDQVSNRSPAATDTFQQPLPTQFSTPLLNSRSQALPLQPTPNLARHQQLQQQQQQHEEQQQSVTTTPKNNTNVINPSTINRISMAQSVLANANAAQLRERICSEGEERLRMGYDEFVEMCLEEGFAKTEEQAKQLCQSMHDAGVVLWHGNVVYLRPLEVAEMVLEALPDTQEEIHHKVKKLSKEFLPLKQQKDQADRVAEYWSSIFVWGGFFALVCQFIVFFILTFQITSWDVMEPVTYFAGQTLVLIGYIYFLTTKDEFGFRNVTNKLHNTFFNQQTQQLGKFDLQRYNKLMRDIQRWERYLKRFKYII